MWLHVSRRCKLITQSRASVPHPSSAENHPFPFLVSRCCFCSFKIIDIQTKPHSLWSDQETPTIVPFHTLHKVLIVWNIEGSESTENCAYLPCRETKELLARGNPRRMNEPPGWVERCKGLSLTSTSRPRVLEGWPKLRVSTRLTSKRKITACLSSK